MPNSTLETVPNSIELDYLNLRIELLESLVKQLKRHLVQKDRRIKILEANNVILQKSLSN